MEKYIKVILFVALIAAVCATTYWIMFTFATGSDEHAEIGHEWLHEKLDLNSDEIEMIEQIEERYAARRETLEQTFNLKQNALAKILLEQDTYSDIVKNAVRDIHQAHGDLETMSIEHYYDMLSILPSSKHTRLRELAAQALSQPE